MTDLEQIKKQMKTESLKINLKQAKRRIKKTKKVVKEKKKTKITKIATITTIKRKQLLLEELDWDLEV